MASEPLPAWVTEPGRSGVHEPQGSWSVAQRSYIRNFGLTSMAAGCVLLFMTRR